jgi:hypothetical protein
MTTSAEFSQLRFCRIVTGLVLTPDAKISLGRDRKRRISAALHHISVSRNVTEEHRSQTRGWLAYANSVEPSFIATMERKYPRAFRSVMGMPFASPSMAAASFDSD